MKELFIKKYKKNCFMLVAISCIFAFMFCSCGNATQTPVADNNTANDTQQSEAVNTENEKEEISEEISDEESVSEETEDVNTEISDENTESAEAETTSATNKGRGRNKSEVKIEFDDLEHFEIQSNCLADGVWDDKISNTDRGNNISPDLSWEAVEGATKYAVYMIDNGWLHMVAMTDETSISEGTIDGTNDNKYVGPYPPEGTHTYVVYVVALKGESSPVKVFFDEGGNSIDKIISGLDNSSDNEEGNVISAGMLEGTFTR